MWYVRCIDIFESFSFTFKKFIFVICVTNFLHVFKIPCKGQLISKWLFGILNSSKERTKNPIQFQLHTKYYDTSCRIVIVPVWKNWRHQEKGHFFWNRGTIIWQLILIGFTHGIIHDTGVRQSSLSFGTLYRQSSSIC